MSEMSASNYDGNGVSEIMKEHCVKISHPSGVPLYGRAGPVIIMRLPK